MAPQQQAGVRRRAAEVSTMRRRLVVLINRDSG
jgi:hypothetical protein